MIVLRLFALTLLSYFCYAAEEDVLDLTDSDFTSTLQNHETTLVMFYAPWCGHCKRLKPEYAQAAGILKNDDTPVALAKVDCTEGGKSICEQYSVSGYPTLKIFRDGAVSQEYNGPREANGIVKHMRAQVGPSSRELKSIAEFTTFIEKDEPAVVGYFEKETDLKAHFLSAANTLRESVRFAHTSSPDILARSGYTNDVIFYRPKHLHSKFEDTEEKYTADIVITPLASFIKEVFHGLVGHRQKDTINDFESPLIVVYYNVDYVKNVKGTNYWRNRVLKVAKNVKDITFAISNKDDFANELNEFGIEFVKGDKPVVAGRDSHGMKYVMKEEFSVEALEAFAKQLSAGTLEAFIKSEPVPENDGPVTVAVGKNFDDVVTNADMDALIEFYAPWCGHCQKLTPIWDELGQKMKNEEVAIVKMDATANDWPKALYEVSGFPTLYWKPKGKDAKPVRYSGRRELDDFIKYIAEHATNELSGYDRSGNEKKTEL